jgi:hypothetical protein
MMVYQVELDTLIGHRNQVDKIRRLQAALSRSIIERIARGAEVEPGVHMAHVAGRWHDGMYVRKLRVK